MPTQPDRSAPEPRGCEYCGEHMRYIGTDYDSDGDYVAEYWCENCKEYLYFVVTQTEPAASARDAARGNV